MLPNASLPPPHAELGAATDDELLLRALAHGDERAFAHALDRYYHPMLRLALSHVREQAAAEDVIQESWIAALNGIERFEGRSSLKTWLFHILRNIARARGRRDARVWPLSQLRAPDAAAGNHGADDDRLLSVESVARDPEQQLLGRELAAHIEAAIARLPSRMRDVVVLRDVEGWAAEDVCNILGISDTNQRVILHRARERVRDELREYLADGPCGRHNDVR